MAAILDVILDSLRALRGFSRTFSMLFCPYFQSYHENFSLLWATSSIQLMFFKWQPFWTPFWVFWKGAGGFSRTCSMLFCPYFWSHTGNFSFENDVHFGRPLEFLGQLQSDCPEPLVCYSTNFSGPILKISACSELIQAYKRCSLKMTSIFDAILDFLESSRGILQDF